MPELVTVVAESEQLIFTDEELYYIRTLLGSVSTEIAQRLIEDNRGEDSKIMNRVCEMLGTKDPSYKVYKSLADYVDKIFTLEGKRR